MKYLALHPLHFAVCADLEHCGRRTITLTAGRGRFRGHSGRGLPWALAGVVRCRAARRCHRLSCGRIGSGSRSRGGSRPRGVGAHRIPLFLHGARDDTEKQRGRSRDPGCNRPSPRARHCNLSCRMAPSRPISRYGGATSSHCGARLSVRLLRSCWLGV